MSFRSSTDLSTGSYEDLYELMALRLGSTSRNAEEVLQEKEAKCDIEPELLNKSMDSVPNNSKK